MRARQQGYVLLALLLVLLIAGSSVLLGGFNNRQQLVNTRHAESLYQLTQAKEALLAFAANSARLYDNNRGPGYLPCPDITGDGFPNEGEDCDSDEPLAGRLPNAVDTGTTIFRITAADSDAESRFWYVVAPRHVYHSEEDALRLARWRSSAQNPEASLRLTLDGNSNYVALLIAPGEVLDFQERIGNQNVFAAYVESALPTSPFSFTSTSANPANHNDIVLGITHDEYMRKVGPALAGSIKELLQDTYEVDSVYPEGKTADGINGVDPEFLSIATGMPAWMSTEAWLTYVGPITAPPDLADMFEMTALHYESNPLISPASFTLGLPGCQLQFHVTAPTGFDILGPSC